MHLQDVSSTGSPAGTEARQSILGAGLTLGSIAGPTYVTAQSLVQQVAYILSDKIFSFSPETFDLDDAARAWAQANEQNNSGYTTKVVPSEIRSGAGTLALGYMFSKDFELKKRHIPQAVVASSPALQFLRPAFDQLSLLYSVSNPLVAHVAALDYSGSKQGQFVSDYATSMVVAEDLGYGLILSHSAHETQHMSLLATLLAQDLPVIHTYDGVRVGREVTRVIDVLDKAGLSAAYDAVLKSTQSDGREHLKLEGKILNTIKSFNDELGTDYKPFEYYGHSAAETVLVTFGSVESTLAAQIAASLAKSGSRVGVVSVRLYRPFIEESFLRILPQSTRLVAVLGQVASPQIAQEGGSRSQLYEDVLAAISFNRIFQFTPDVRDIKYPRSEVWTPAVMSSVFQMLSGKPQQPFDIALIDGNVQQYSFWNVNDTPSVAAADFLAQALAKDSAQNVTVSTTHDNTIQGGVHRIDIRKSPKSLDAPYSVTSSDAAVVTDVKLLGKIDIIGSIRPGGKVILLLPNVKDEDVEKKIPAVAKKAIAEHGIGLYLIDSTRTGLDPDQPQLESLILQTAFLRVALAQSESIGLQKLATLNSDNRTLEEITADLEKTLREIEVPKEWAEVEVDSEKPVPVADLVANSFVPFEQDEEEHPSQLRSWQKAAKGLLFKEAYGTKNTLRPDLPTKTFTVHVKENRRLTPETYERNIFHIEFDLGTSGLKYDIGEALGVHAENDQTEVLEFIRWYNATPDEIVEVASRENPAVFENRTVFQALMQNIDIYGRPPKKFYESLAEFATDEDEKKNLLTLAGPEGFKEFQRRAEVDTITFADVLAEFPSAHPSFHDLVRIVPPMKRREYSIASCQAVTPTSVALMIVVVNWVDPRGRDRFGQATRYLSRLAVGSSVTVSVKPSVMKLPTKPTAPLIMAGLGTGLAPFRAFVQHRAMEKAQGKDIGSVLLYMGSRHQREEYCYGEEWEAYQAAGVITLLGRAFSRDQPQKIYIQDRMRETLDDIVQAYIKEEGSFYLCGPTWPVPDVTDVLEEAIKKDAKANGVKKIDSNRRIMELKDDGRYVLEVY